MSPRKAPFGTWSSPITADALVQSSTPLVDVLLDPVTRVIYHIERRSSEGGRAVIVDTTANKDVFGADWNSTTKVHEYGGGSAIIYDGNIYFSHSPDGRVYSLTVGSEPKAVTPGRQRSASVLCEHPVLAKVIFPEGKPFRYADFNVHPVHRHLLAAVLEDHTNDDPMKVVNTLVIINVKTQSLTTIASGADFYAAPRFSPDGVRIAYQEWNHPDMPWQRSAIHLSRLSAQDDNIIVEHEKRLAWDNREVSVGYPGWVDADTLIFLTDESGFLNPWVYSVSSKKASPLFTAPVAQDFGLPAFTFADSPYTILDTEEKAILFSALKNGRTVLYIFEWKTKSIIPIENTFVSIRAIQAVDADTLVFIAKSTRTPSAVIKLKISDASSSHPRSTYEILKSSMASLPFPDGVISQPLPLTLGTESEPVYATLYPPTNFEYDGSSHPVEKPPCIVNAHGGPTGIAGQGLDWTRQYFTSRGWAWLDVDYSGSGGYGRKYIDRLNSSWGVADIADCAAAATALASQGRTDGTRTAIRGASAGGFTVLAALSQPTTKHAFAAGTSLFGISDLTLLAKAGTHKFEARYMDKLIGGAVDEIPEVYAERSPLNNAQNIRSPLLLLQGTADKIVPPEQAEAIEKSVREQGGHVEKVLFDGEGHGFIKAESIKVALETERAFYEKVFSIKM
ncbi:alpha/beta-hydrolase [Multifurca ochricompacta]|uniref:Alpha/beta-hydrolase n=1 Tax=Multifurca ochricompacta TaxID=376703 RepID=A0AAD4QM97_9AGAM|nr:alpha/beta-hydrolase [Multifurca ochricompacta]